MVMGFIEYLRAANRRRLDKRHARNRLHTQQPGSVSLTLSSGQIIETAPRTVHLSGVGSRTFFYRPNSVGDHGVMRQIFEQKDYDLHHWPQGQAIIDLLGLLKEQGRLSLIVDMGANIGASSVFFCERYPGAKLLCVEPDPTNADLLAKNMAGLNHALFRGAISNRAGHLSLVDPGHGDWGFRTAAIDSSEATPRKVKAETVQHIIDEFGDGGHPVIAKIDIEGGEADLFADACEWMDVFPCIIVELHDWMLPGAGTSRNFLKQVAARQLDFVHRGENIFLFNTELTKKLASSLAKKT